VQQQQVIGHVELLLMWLGIRDGCIAPHDEDAVRQARVDLGGMGGALQERIAARQAMHQPCSINTSEQCSTGKAKGGSSESIISLFRDLQVSV
jgi:hypothetical protein